MDREMTIVESGNHLGASSPATDMQITMNSPLINEHEIKGTTERITESSGNEVPMEAKQANSPHIETGEGLSKSPDISIEKEIGNPITDENGNLKLELPDNLDNADFSKLLEFDAKNDEALFNSNDLLSQTMNTVNEINIDGIPDDHNEEVTPKDSTSIEAVTSHGDEKEKTQDTSGAMKVEEMEGFEESSIKTDQPTADAIYAEKNESSAEENDGTPPTIIIEKDNPLHTRNNSITPIMFQQHELLAQASQHSVTENNSTDAETFERKPSEPSNENLPLPNEQPTIFAYARLDFQSFTFYVQTLHAIIGRRSENDFSHKVDVNLGPSKSISRRHAQIFYNFGTGRFELSIIGKNGAFVDDIFVEKGNTVPLRNRTKIQIGQIPFQFILPEQERNEDSKSPENPDITESEIKLKDPKKNELKSKKKVSTGTKPKKPQAKPAVKKDKKPPKLPKKVYTLEEIPLEHRTKPTISYSAMLTTCIRKYSTAKGMSLSEIYAGIRELFPYYKYCADGWQSSVRHNLSLNKSFRKVSKEGKGWLWGLDEEYITERERQKKKQSEMAIAKAHAAQLKLEQQQHRQQQVPSQKGKKDIVSQKSPVPARKQNISQTLAANRAASNKKNTASDNQRTMKYLQEQLVILTRDRKGLSKQVIAAILTQALAMTINQVTQAAKNKGITGNPLTALMDKNPQHLNLILAAAVNAATAKVTKGEVKKLVNPETTAALAAKAQNSKPITQPIVQTPNVPERPAPQPSASASSHSINYMHDKPPGPFDPSSLSRFFQPRQNARVASPATAPVPVTIAQSIDLPPKPTPTQNSGGESESGSSSSTASSSESESDSDSCSDDGSGSGSDGSGDGSSTSSESESDSDSGSEIDEKEDKGQSENARHNDTEDDVVHNNDGSSNGHDTLETDEEGHDSKRRKIDEEIDSVNIVSEENGGTDSNINIS
ncbi:hypothetical protein SEUBUCD650_0P03720 [Saccharomyces eubayanus]|uniref:FHL1-like protein n=1 Tax=Saccharomyces eubayanus TaxID=1080349 RepID=A0ABN8VQ53_SACEU|nr:hypothetical protein SEUBUCD650_0P03720 [Saccharomyces eubayanus]